MLRVRSDLTRGLVGWGTASVVLGTVMWVGGARNGSRWLVGVGRQGVAWGAIDVVIAGAGTLANRRPVTDPTSAVTSLRRLLVVNSVLDIGYVTVAAVMSRRRRYAPDGLGVAVQGLALLVLDAVHARRLAPARMGASRSQ